MSVLPLFGVVNTPEMEAAALAVLRSGRIASGPHVAAFEAGLGELLDQSHVVTTVDMTSALHLALYLGGVRPGDDVLTTAFACMSTNSAIAGCGGRPVWVDVAPASACMDVADFERAITSATRAVILYHLAGYPGPAQAIAEICRQRGIVLIEDCDNALLATVDGQQVGTFGDFAVFSFYPNRQINTTEGGALACRDPDDAVRARKLRRFGIDASSFRTSAGEINPQSDIPVVGWSMAMNNLCAALGSVQLQGVAQRMAQTRLHAQQIKDGLVSCAGLTLLTPSAGALPSYWGVLIAVEQRDVVLAALKAHGVAASILHQRNDIYSGFVACRRELPNTDILQRSIIALPCGWWLSAQDVEQLIAAVKSALHASAGQA